VRILHFITSLKVGGAESALYNLLEYWANTSKEVFTSLDENEHIVLYIYDGPFVSKIADLGIRVYKLRGFLSPYDPVAVGRLIKFVKQIKPDVIHSSLWSANILARVVSHLYKIPLICDLHSDCNFHGAVRNFIEKKTIQIPRRFVAIAPSVKTSFRNLFYEIEKNLVMIRNGIDVKRIHERAEREIITRENIGCDQNDFIIGTVGRLHKIKGHDLLIKAFAKFGRPNKKLVIVGGGPEYDTLKQLAEALGIQDKIRFVGEKANPYPYYRLFDCFVLSSQSEGLSIALLEALCFGLPIVTTNKNKIHDVISDGINGFVIPLNSLNDLVMAFEKIFTGDTMIAEMKKRNVKMVEESFQIDAVAREYVGLYKDVFGG